MDINILMDVWREKTGVNWELTDSSKKKIEDLGGINEETISKVGYLEVYYLLDASKVLSAQVEIGDEKPYGFLITLKEDKTMTSEEISKDMFFRSSVSRFTIKEISDPIEAIVPTFTRKFIVNQAKDKILKALED